MYSNITYRGVYNSPLDFGSYGSAAAPPNVQPFRALDKAVSWGWKFTEISLGHPDARGQTYSAGAVGQAEREELARLAKLNKMSLSVHHTPQEDPTGFTGQGFHEIQRQKAEYDMKSTIDMVDDIGKKAGIDHIPVVIHSSAGTPSNADKENVYYYVDRYTGALSGIPKEEEYNPRTEKFTVKKPEKALEELNERKRASYISNLASTDIYLRQEENLADMEELKLDLIGKSDKEILEKARGNMETFERLKEEQRKAQDEGVRRVEEKREMLGEAVKVMKKDKEYLENEIRGINEKYYNKETHKYNQLVPIDDYARENAAKTIANLAKYSLKKESKPMVCVEHVFPGMYGDNPEEMQKLVEAARDKFVEMGVKEGMSKGAAERDAKELIGMTVDVGHLNMWRRYGPEKFNEMQNKFGELAPFIKHVHLSDNMGDCDAHLPVGWGNAPNKEVMERLKKAGYSGKVMLEAYGLPEGNALGAYQSMPYLNAPVATPGPTWSEAAGQYLFGDYPFSTGHLFPYVHSQEYGMGFSGLPGSLGGTAPGQKSRFGGTPMS
jgi:sugar phosphate isomerase/epimerase